MFYLCCSVIALPFGLSKATDHATEKNVEKLSQMVPFAIIIVYYYYLTLIYLLFVNGIYKQEVELKINVLVEDPDFLNYSTVFATKIFQQVTLPVTKKISVPTPNLVLAILLMVAFIAVTICLNLITNDTLLSVFKGVSIFTLIFSIIIFFFLSKALKEKWIAIKAKELNKRVESLKEGMPGNNYSPAQDL